MSNKLNNTDFVTEVKQLVSDYKLAVESKDIAKLKDIQPILIDKFSKMFEVESKLAVNSIESKVETTQNRYGDYMNVLTDLKGIYRLAFAKAMKDNGGNSEGIDNALKLLNPNSY